MVDRPKVEIADRAGWRRWLEANHKVSGSIWLVYPRKGAHPGDPPMEALVEEALCFGWIDSLPRKLDEARSMILMSPRKPGSNWSAVNRARAERLTAAGTMAPAGLAAVARAKVDGTWSALDGVEALQIPPDLATALEQKPPALENFTGFPRSVRRGILEWILNARRGETQARRIAETAEAASRGERANQWRG